MKKNSGDKKQKVGASVFEFKAGKTVMPDHFGLNLPHLIKILTVTLYLQNFVSFPAAF